MTTSQYFVYKRPIAWTLLIATMMWGAYAYRSMPQRQDPLIQIRSGVVLTWYPGAVAVEVEQEVSRKIEKVMTENPAVEHVRSISQKGQSIVFIDLYETIKNAEAIWQDLSNKLEAITNLPEVAGQPLRPQAQQGLRRHRRDHAHGEQPADHRLRGRATGRLDRPEAGSRPSGPSRGRSATGGTAASWSTRRRSRPTSSSGWPGPPCSTWSRPAWPRTASTSRCSAPAWSTFDWPTSADEFPASSRSRPLETRNPRRRTRPPRHLARPLDLRTSGAGQRDEDDMFKKSREVSPATPTKICTASPT